MADGIARAPRSIIKVNGQRLTGCVVEWEVNNNNHYAADTFRLVLALSGLPTDRRAAWWSSQISLTVEIWAGLPPDPENYAESQLQNWIVGNVDDVEFDPAATTVTLSGRDKTALLIDTKTTEKWPERRASDIALELAARHGLVAVVTTTTAKVGKFYELEKVHMTDERSEWDLLTYLANKEGFVAFVRGNELHFEPRPTVEPWPLRWEDPTDARGAPQANAKAVKFTRNLTVARGIIVEVRSWNHKHKKGYTAYYPRAPKRIKAGTSGPAGGAQTYVFVRAGMTQQDADEFAANKHRELTRHEMKLEASMPADDALNTESLIRVTGTGSSFDQDYFPDSITRRMSLTEGYTMTVHAKNHNPDSESLA